MDFSLRRLWAIVRKEFILMIRDPSVILIMAILPVILVCLAGYAINTSPKHVPTVLMDYDHSEIGNSFVQKLKNTRYFSFIDSISTSSQAYHLLKTNQAFMIVTIPHNFSKLLLRQQSPALLIEDGSLGTLSTAKAYSALIGVQQHLLLNLQPNTIEYLRSKSPAFKIILHRLYDPDHNPRYDSVPGIIGLALMLTMLTIATIVSFRDVQGGTIDYLLASPTHPAEILLAEIIAYIIIGYGQLFVGLSLAHYLFEIPFLGSVALLAICALPYIIAELSLGFTISTFAQTQFQALQLVNLFIAFSIILTGFIFPVFGMPSWARMISQVLPLTHFLVILRGIMLKGNGAIEVWQNLWPLLVYCVVIIIIAISRFLPHYRKS